MCALVNQSFDQEVDEAANNDRETLTQKEGEGAGSCEEEEGVIHHGGGEKEVMKVMKSTQV